MQYKRILVLAPHTDDGELGCGGTINRFCKEGSTVHYVAFSTCRRSLPAGTPPDALEKEVKKATKILGIPSSNLILFDYDVRVFNTLRQQLLDDMIRLKNEINPDLILAPSLNDTHQDHQVIANESIRAFKEVSIWGYEMPWNNLSFNTQCFVELQEEHVSVKAKALEEYESQKHRRYLNKEFVYSLANIRGIQINVKYAEAFEIIRTVVKLPSSL